MTGGGSMVDHPAFTTAVYQFTASHIGQSINTRTDQVVRMPLSITIHAPAHDRDLNERLDQFKPSALAA
jgi:hypothetical protein